MRNIAILGALSLVFTIIPAYADFDITATSTASGTAGTAVFVYSSSADTLSITLASTNSSFSSAANILTGVEFDYTGGTDLVGTPTSATTTEAADGYYQWDCTTGTCVGSTTAVSSGTLLNGSNWVDTTSGSSYTLDMLKAQPGYGIVNDAINGITTGGSIETGSHNPYINTTTFVLPVTGDLTGLSSVDLVFGTTLSSGAVTTVLTNTPEPSFWIALTVGMGALVFFAQRKKQTSLPVD